MAKCPNPYCFGGYVHVPQHGGIEIYRCPKCGGAYGEVSCCEGAVGDAYEEPRDPNAST